MKRINIVYGISLMIMLVLVAAMCVNYIIMPFPDIAVKIIGIAIMIDLVVFIFTIIKRTKRG